MTNFGKKSLLWLFAGSLIAAGGGVAWRVTAAAMMRAEESLRQVEKSEADLFILNSRLKQWQKAHPPGSLAGSAGGPHIEPVALSADFSPGEFLHIGQMLAGMYTERGALNLKSFTLEMGANGTAHVVVSGDKIFVQ